MSFSDDASPNMGQIVLPLGKGAEGIVYPNVADAVIPKGTRAIVTPRQTHTSNVRVVEHIECSYPDTDALVSFNSEIAVGVRTADCVPVLISAPDIHAVAAIHAGWKGTYGKIVGNAIALLKKYGADPAKMYAAIGPSICGRCYEVSEELADLFNSNGFGDCISCTVEDNVPGENTDFKLPHIDLAQANRQTLCECGCDPRNIFMSEICTYHTSFSNPSQKTDGKSSLLYPFPSWRRMSGTNVRLLTVARLTEHNFE